MGRQTDADSSRVAIAPRTDQVRERAPLATAVCLQCGEQTMKKKCQRNDSLQVARTIKIEQTDRQSKWKRKQKFNRRNIYKNKGLSAANPRSIKLTINRLQRHRHRLRGTCHHVLGQRERQTSAMTSVKEKSDQSRAVGTRNQVLAAPCRC